MATTAQITTSVSGVATGVQTNTITGETELTGQPDVAAAVQGTLTTRTTSTAGSFTMASAGHGITTASTVDIFWDGGQCYGATVGTVSGTTVPISAVAGGDALPIATTVCTISKRESVPFVISGDDAKLIVGTAPTKGYIILRTVTPTNELVMKLSAASIYVWHNQMAGSNPIAGDSIVEAMFSHDNTLQTVSTMKLCVIR